MSIINFYYVAKYNNFTRAQGCWETASRMCKGNELSGTATSLYASGADEPWSFSDYGRGKRYTWQPAMNSFYGRGGTGRMCGTVPWECIAIGASETALNLFLLDKLKEFLHTRESGCGRSTIIPHRRRWKQRRGTVDFAVVSHL